MGIGGGEGGGAGGGDKEEDDVDDEDGDLGGAWANTVSRGGDPRAISG